ncbi:MAG TPA: hypothetical protein PKD15_01935 [Candidatus Saccharibacteria bacterium]|jgi:hypothetical protein|nr:hypothetical protein [Candidatus Saccharibacteria bacterium]
MHVKKQALVFQAAEKALTDAQIEYEKGASALPDECEVAVKKFIQPYGDMVYEDEEFAGSVTAPFCEGNTTYVGLFRDAFSHLQELQGIRDVASNDMALTLAAADVEPTQG